MAATDVSLSGAAPTRPPLATCRNSGPALMPAFEQQVELGFRLSVAGQLQFTSVCGRDVHVDHLHGGELLERAARGQAGCERMQAPFESDVEAVGEEGDEDVSLDALFMLMEDRTDGEIAFDVLEGFFHRHESRSKVLRDRAR